MKSYWTTKYLLSKRKEDVLLGGSEKPIEVFLASDVRKEIAILNQKHKGNTMKQKTFRLRREIMGDITICCYSPGGWSKGFSMPNGNGTEFDKLMKRLTFGDEIEVRFL